MATHDPTVEIPSDSAIENAKIGISSNVLLLFDNITWRPTNPYKVIIDEVTPLTESLQMASSIIITDVKWPLRTNTKDDYDVIRHIHAIPAVNNMFDVLCIPSKTI